MNDTITIRGIVATAPRHLVTSTGLSITNFRLASPSRRWDRATSTWVNGDTNWFTVTAFRTLATNVHESVVKGDRVLVAGRLRIRPWERDDRSGVAIEIDGDAIGHDLAFGRSQWRKTTRHTSDETAGPGEVPTNEERAAARAASAHPGHGLEGRAGSAPSLPDDVGLEGRVGSAPSLPDGAYHDPTDGHPDLGDPGHGDPGFGAAGFGDGTSEPAAPPTRVPGDWMAEVGADGVVPEHLVPGAELEDDGDAPASPSGPDPVF